MLRASEHVYRADALKACLTAQNLIQKAEMDPDNTYIGADNGTSRQGRIRKTVCSRICTLTEDDWATCQTWNDGASFD